MRTYWIQLATLIILSFSTASFAWNDDHAEGGCGRGLARNGNPNESYCQCSDLLCQKPMYTDCISRAYCCEAFGNIGAR